MKGKDKVTEKAEESKALAERGILETVKQSAVTEETSTALMMLGAIKAVSHIAQYLSAQTMRGLQKIRDEKHFESLGFTRFDDFLDEHPHSPMSYKQFNDRERLLISEGDEMFDVLNTLKFSIRKRRLLGAGNVILEDGKMIVKRTNETGKEFTEKIEISDQNKILQTLSALADQNVQLQTKNEKLTKRVARQDDDIAELTDKIQRGGGNVNSEFFSKYIIAKSALAQLAEHSEKVVTIVEKEKSGEIYLRDLFSEFSKVRQSFGRNDLRFDSPEETDGEFSDIISKINDDELADLMD